MSRSDEIRSRPFCPGCGLHYAVHGEHRDTCTAKKGRAR